MDTIRIALTKGRLEQKSVEMFEAAGFDCSQLRDKGRRLLLDVGGLPAKAVLAKAADVVTYVEYGACDIGIVGKDTIIEHGGSFYEVMELGFGKCRFVLAAKEGNDIYRGFRRLKIATKYPAVARNFFDKKGMDIEIIKIEGSVELAPLLDLADGIVDITETGATLKENGLVIVDEVCNISARMIVNTASMKMKSNIILPFIEKLKEVCENNAQNS
ncbi:MAG: ATP phosphoribosyltransferase [Ruminococcaceae bacterium]|nr:ATP phosphoribosyltransferase [Oscillospiraceae bacterium]